MKRKKSLNWKYIAAGRVLVLVALGVVALVSPMRRTRTSPTYDYLKVERGPLRVTLRESAVVEPEHRLTVTPPIPGRIDTINVANGVAVKQGQVLAWISSTDRAALMDAARAAGGKEIKFWEDVYKPAPLIAPLDGHIISTAVVPGQVVVTAQTVFTMSDHLIVQANVDETDLEPRLARPDGRHHVRQLSRRAPDRQGARDRLRLDHGEQRDDLPGEHLPRYDARLRPQRHFGECLSPHFRPQGRAADPDRRDHAGGHRARGAGRKASRPWRNRSRWD